jgi:UrcA family protein
LLVADGAFQRDSSGLVRRDSEPSQGAATGITIEEDIMKNIASIAALLFVSCGVAHGRDITTVVGATPTVEHVSYRGAELATAIGIRNLRARVHQAVTRLCRPSADTFMVSYRQLDCTSPALHEAYAQVDRAVTRWRDGMQASAGSISVRAR